MTLHAIGFIALRLIGFAFFVLLVVRAAAWRRSRCNGGRAILEKRLAAGDITEEQYRRMRDVMEE